MTNNDEVKREEASMPRDAADAWAEVDIDAAEKLWDYERDAVGGIADKSEPEDRPLDNST